MTLPVFPETADSLWLDARLATMAGQTPYGLLDQGAMAVNEGRIVWLGAQSALPTNAAKKARS